ncbi:MAG TPA: hypothetical protein VEU30_11420, partial [Thermoanaerobaculia bacterium]|nr:hypothetical protein [Thermoanaerobaculia bacterium]
MRNLVLLLLCCFTLGPALLAEEADLTIVSTQSDKSTLATGERFTITSQVRNNGPDAARDVVVSFSTNLGLFPLSIGGPAGWTCQRAISVPNSAVCTAATFASDAVANFSVVALAPAVTAPEGSPVTLTAFVWSNTTDSRSTNNMRMVPLTVTAAAGESDLSTIVAPRDVPAQPDTQTTVDVAVRNSGPSNANDVVVAIDTTSQEPVALVGIAANWVCTPTAQPSTLCRTSTIAAGATSTFQLRFRTPPQDGYITVYARVQAENSRDLVAANDLSFATVNVGTSVLWRRMLLPVTAQAIPGAGGSLWRSDITMLLKSPVPVDVRPSPCDTIIVTCPFVPPPLNRPFNAADFVINHDAPGGQFLYVPAPDEDKVRFNIRVYDQARTAETAGAEVPVAREEDFTNGTISLLGIPVAAEYRHTLRVYDADAHPNARVLIHVYAGAETTPRVSVVRTLEQSPLLQRTTPALLPTHPSYLQLDLGQLTSLAGLSSVR